jgi:hypothetical protein
LGFNVRREFSGSKSGLDLLLEPLNRVFVVIELKYCPDPRKLTEEDKNEPLARAARIKLSEDALNQALSQALQEKLTFSELHKLISQLPPESQTKAGRVRSLAQEADRVLDENEKTNALAELAKYTFKYDEIKELLKMAKPKAKLNVKKIEESLTKAAQKALSDIKARECHSFLKLEADAIIDLGLAIFPNGPKVKAAFGPKIILAKPKK